MRGILVVSALAFSLALSCAGCAGATGIIRAGVACAPGLVDGVSRAIESGGSDWVSIVVAGLACVPRVINALEARHPPGLLENASRDELQLHVEQRYRIDTAMALWREAHR
jgi:hypothetical protein